ncbi:uncharacterized protein E0L32_004991 [Thyridium curvatum]|uniref:Uncharacterized protein n=1 Tax=Thyridium curvatum TaxID=1093900 RepID=A0A507AY35_9PEZI|nr:uncharacterized protein E0L32_004991 [Thyridium curvatum]TPX14882.1 hypothetical protein E0L32_004991 [Thyridium curvatum]
MSSGPGPGFFKYRCIYMYLYECPNWSWVNRQPCSTCMGLGRFGEEFGLEPPGYKKHEKKPQEKTQAIQPPPLTRRRRRQPYPKRPAGSQALKPAPPPASAPPSSAPPSSAPPSSAPPLALRPFPRARLRVGAE